MISGQSVPKQASDLEASAKKQCWGKVCTDPNLAALRISEIGMLLREAA